MVKADNARKMFLAGFMIVFIMSIFILAIIALGGMACAIKSSIM